MTTILRFCAGIAGVAALAASAADAATRCAMPAGPLAALPAVHAPSARGEALQVAADTCRSDCRSSATAPKPLLALDMPPAIPLLLVTHAEDVVAWHSEIYRSLAAERAQPQGLICERATPSKPRL